MTVRLVAALVLLALGVACGPADPDAVLLQRSWDGYRARFIARDGRVVRPENGGDTVSEGQAYALLRAAWMDDQATFDRVWTWTKTHLTRTGRETPSLLAWHWVPDEGGRIADWNVASDADADYALALLLAADRWPEPLSSDLPPYAEEARRVLGDLMAMATAPDEAGRLQFLPGVWADQRENGEGLVLNPSYLAPASFRVFHAATGDARWLALAAGSYEVLDALCAPGSPARAVPDWVRWWSAERWAPTAMAGEPRSGWDAVRVPWRVATDVLWFDASSARDYLGRCVSPFVRDRMRDGMAAAYGIDGQVNEGADHPLANALYAFALSATERDRLLARVRTVTSNDGVFFGEPDRYYVNSLAYLPFLARADRHVPPRPGGP